MQDGKTALMKAITTFWKCRETGLKIIRLLLDKGCDMNVQDKVCS